MFYILNKEKMLSCAIALSTILILFIMATVIPGKDINKTKETVSHSADTSNIEKSIQNQELEQEGNNIIQEKNRWWKMLKKIYVKCCKFIKHRI